jgi:GTP 3',8-cyclase
MTSGAGLFDTFGRLHDKLRVSVTDRCNIRCYFCMPEHDVQYVPREQILRFEEITRFVRIGVKLGIRKVRVTGGEPLVRKGVDTLIGMLRTIDGIQDLALTTNGILLAGQAEALYKAGLRRLNVHLDTLDAGRFQRIARYDGLAQVLEGLAEARRVGFGPIKINAVAVKGLTDPDIVPLARFGREHDFEVRFIEFMPLDAQGLWDRARVLTAAEIVDVISREVAPLKAIPEEHPSAPATEYRYADGIGRVGFIASVSRPFCENCNRVRLTADGKLRYCLFAIEETNLLEALRGGATDEEIAATVRAAVWKKWEGHEINTARFTPPPRPMYAIGG